MGLLVNHEKEISGRLEKFDAGIKLLYNDVKEKTTERIRQDLTISLRQQIEKIGKEIEQTAEEHFQEEMSNWDIWQYKITACRQEIFENRFKGTIIEPSSPSEKIVEVLSYSFKYDALISSLLSQEKDDVAQVLGDLYDDDQLPEALGSLIFDLLDKKRMFQDSDIKRAARDLLRKHFPGILSQRAQRQMENRS